MNVCAVVPNAPCKKETSKKSINALGNNKWFVVSNRLFGWNILYKSIYLKKKLYNDCISLLKRIAHYIHIYKYINIYIYEYI